jgi:hypothetical protein
LSGFTLPAAVDVGVTPPAKAGNYQANVVFREGTTSVFTLPVTYTLSADFQVMPATINVIGKQHLAPGPVVQSAVPVSAPPSHPRGP